MLKLLQFGCHVHNRLLRKRKLGTLSPGMGRKEPGCDGSEVLGGKNENVTPGRGSFMVRVRWQSCHIGVRSAFTVQFGL